jgi:hypothetical protein
LVVADRTEDVAATIVAWQLTAATCACERKPFFCWNTDFSRQSKKRENEKVTENCKQLKFFNFSNKRYS